MEPLFYSVADAQRLLNLSHSTIHEMIRRKHLHSVKMGRRRLIPRDAVQAYADSLVVPADPAA